MSDISSGRPRAQSAPLPLRDAATSPANPKVGRTRSGSVVTVCDVQHRPSATGASRIKPLRERKVVALDDQLSVEETAACLKALKGRTIKPRVADQYIRQIPINHLGQIVERDPSDPSQKKLTRADVETLKGSVIKNLSETNSRHQRDAPRIETEIIFDFYFRMKGEIAKNGDPSGFLTECLQRLKRIWLEGADTSKVVEFLEAFEEVLAEEYPDLAASAKELAREASGRKVNTQYHDNVLARHFEAQVVKLLVANPPASVLKASGTIGRYISLAVSEAIESKPNEEEVFEDIAADCALQSRPYPAAGSFLQQFIASPNKKNFSLMMKTCGNGFDVLKVNWLITIVKDNVDLPFVGDGMTFYKRIIRPARSATPSVLSKGSSMMPTFIVLFERELMNLADKYNLKEATVVGRGLAAIEEAKRAFAAGDTGIQRRLRELERLNRNYRRQLRNLRRIGAPKEDFEKLERSFHERKQPIWRALEDEIENAASIFRPLIAEMGLNSRFGAAAAKMKELLEREVENALSDVYQYGIIGSLAETKVELPGNKKTIETKGFGAQLPHQRSVDYPDSDDWPVREALPSYLHVNVANPSQFEQRGLRANRYFATGASGTIILLVNAFLHVKSEARKIGAHLNLGDAFLGSLMFLTFDGGHSLSESYGALMAYAGYKKAERHRDNLRDAEAQLNDFILDYKMLEMEDFDASADTQLAVRTAMEQAFDLTLAAFEAMNAERDARSVNHN